MRRIVLTVIVLTAVAAGVLYGANFWEKKDFKTWSEKEVQKILFNSPWAKSLSVPIGPPMAAMPGGGRHRGGGMGGGAGIPAGGGGGIEGGGGGGGGMPGAGRRGGGMGPGMAMEQTVKVLFRWISALPVRQAIARSRFGDELDTEEAGKILNLQDNRYILAVSGLPRGMAFGGPHRKGRGGAEGAAQDPEAQRNAAIEQLKQRASLRVKGKDPVHPNHVQLNVQQAAADIYFFFPKGEDGGLDISLDDKEVEFRLETRQRTLKRKFKLKDMVYKGKLEI